jgi:hypothetical protein
MPAVRKLTPEEVQTIENKGKGQRKIIKEQYDRFLSEYETGEYGEAELDGDEKRLTVRNRLKAAASRRDVGVQFLHTTGKIIRFKVVPNNGQSAAPRATRKRMPAPKPAPTPVATDTPPTTKRRGGRPKKVRA